MATSEEAQSSSRSNLEHPTSRNDTKQSPEVAKIDAQAAFIVNDCPPSPTKLDAHETQHDLSVRLPNQKGVVNHVALDMGGSLTKLVYFAREPDSDNIGGRVQFLKFEADQVDRCLEFIQQLKDNHTSQSETSAEEFYVVATGGGAYKYYDTIKNVLGLEILREDEMECLIMGLDFLITEIPGEVFSYSDTDPTVFADAHTDIYPYLLVNIGSGVSMIKVSGKRDYQRIGGTSLGGGTFWGLLSLLTGASTFDEMLGMADRGDNSAVDLLVGDIYGTDYDKIGLKSSVIASSFGKVFNMKRQGEDHAEQFGMSERGTQASTDLPGTNKTFGPEDISRSLLLAVSNNIGQIAYLQSEKHNLKHIYFAGSFIHGHRQTIKTLSNAISFWSEGGKRAYFLRHEGYLGSVGAFVKQQPKGLK